MSFEFYDILAEGHDINDESFRLELFKLLFYVVGDKVVCELGQDNPDCTYTELHNEFFDNEVMGLLISTAIKGRLYDEYYDSIFKDVGPECGKLRFESGETKALSLRDAFNKILHGRFHRWDKIGELKSIEPFLYLYGKYQGEKWEAILDLKKYIHYCTAATLASKAEIMQKQIKRRTGKDIKLEA